MLNNKVQFLALLLIASVNFTAMSFAADNAITTDETQVASEKPSKNYSKKFCKIARSLLDPLVAGSIGSLFILGISDIQTILKRYEILETMDIRPTTVNMPLSLAQAFFGVIILHEVVKGYHNIKDIIYNDGKNMIYDRYAGNYYIISE